MSAYSTLAAKRISELESMLGEDRGERQREHDLRCRLAGELETAREKIANQAERIRVLEGPTHHAGGLRARADDGGRVRQRGCLLQPCNGACVNRRMICDKDETVCKWVAAPPGAEDGCEDFEPNEEGEK